MKREPTPEGRALPLATARHAGLRILAGVALVAFAAHAAAQSPRPPGATASHPVTVREEGVRWQALTPAQREALAPLERDWPGIDAPRKQKWIALAARFNTLSPDERARINARMVEWAKLTPAERGQARLRFEEARQLPVPDRGERWRAYQALPPEQREELAARAATAASAPHDAASKPAKGGRDSKEAKFNVVPNPALAQPPRPVAPTMVQAAPGATTTVITRRPAPPPHQQSGMPKIATTPEFVNRSTLLPKRGPQAAAIASAPAAAARPAPALATPLAAASRPAVAATPAASRAPAQAPAPAPAPLAATSAPATSR
jgi:hypothetical protein